MAPLPVADNFVPIRKVTLVPYLLAFSITWIFAALATWLVGNGSLFLALNSLGGPLADPIFGYITCIGDGAFFIVSCLLLAFWNRKAGLAALTAFALSAGLSQILKHLVFDTWVRPKSFFESRHTVIHLPDGVEVFSDNSFPSGHSASVFCLACMLAYFFPRPRVQVAVLATAWLVGLSRIMQGQHFPFDVLAGALLGTASALVVRDAYYKWGQTEVAPGNGGKQNDIRTDKGSTAKSPAH